MYRKYEERGFSNHFDFIMIDLLALLISFTAAYWLKFKNLDLFFAASWRGILAVTFLLDLAVLLVTTPFSGVIERNGSVELIHTFKNALCNFVLCCIVMYVLKCGPTFSRTVMILLYLFYWILSYAFRWIWKKAVCAQLNTLGSVQKIFVVGCRANMPRLLRSISSEFLNQYKVAGICLTDGDPGEIIKTQIELLGEKGQVKTEVLDFFNTVTLDEVANFVLENHVQAVFIGENPSVLSAETYEKLASNGKQIHLDISTMVGFTPSEQSISTVGTFKALTVGSHTLNSQQIAYMGVKRCLDFIISVAGCILLLPLGLVLKVCYLLSGDAAPIVYAQTRIGLNGQPFKLYKFRSMVSNADDVLKTLLQKPEYKQEWTVKQKLEQDPRVTSVGKIIRKTSLDELPQLINILRGDMSLIGPRPLLEGELEEHKGLQMYYNVKPGITGWWACNGRSNTTYEERLSLEYYYVEHCGAYLDLLCFIKTIVSLFSKKGAQ